MNRKIAVGLGILCIVLAAILAVSLMNDMTIIRNKDSQLAALNQLQTQYNDLFQNYTSLEIRFESVTANYTDLMATYQSLQANYVALSGEHTSLGANYSTLQGTYQNLLSQHDSLNTNYNTLQSDFNTLQNQYSSLQTSYNALELSFSNLQTSYNISQTQYNQYVSNYQRLLSLVNQRCDQNNIEPFITPTDPAVSDIVYQITGGWSNHSDFNEYWSDAKAMYDWVVNNVDDRNDGLTPMLPYDPSGNLQYITDMWQFPNETLNIREGDCEDQAILLCSMIRCYNDYNVECIYLYGETSGHIGVQIPVTGSKLVVFDPAGEYYSHDFWGNIVYNDITTEINNWLNYWKPQMGQDVFVHRVFSDYIDKTFSSTNEYTVWMYSR